MLRGVIFSERRLCDPLPILEPVPFAVAVTETVALAASWAGDGLRVSEIIGHSGVAVDNFDE
jgi:hypothetical protein